MKGHLFRGEERVTVALRDGTQAVDVEIVSISKAGPSLKAKGIWPFIGKMQSTFFEQQMDFLEQNGGGIRHPRDLFLNGEPFPTRRRRQQHNNRQPSPLDAQLVVDF
jgi:hypothetical protein